MAETKELLVTPQPIPDGTLSEDDKSTLRGWGFRDPFMSQVAEVTADSVTHYWMGGFSPDGRAPVFAAFVARGRSLTIGPVWFCGTVDKAGFEAAESPTDYALDSAMFAMEALSGFLMRAINEVENLLPSGYANVEVA